MTNRPSEFSLISKYFAPLAGEGSFGFKDDAAQFLASPDHTLVITQDACAEGIHFFAGDAPSLIAKKALRVNLSDLAAKGAKPICFSLALGLGENWGETWIADFAKGLGEDIEKFEISLSGGDTFRTGGGMVISITAIGEVADDKYISRLGAQPGDILFTTGTIGDAALGLQARLGKLPAISAPHIDYLQNRYLLPQPRMGFASILGEFASASMDVSDGLVGDLEKLCRVSGVSAELELGKVPFSQAASACIEHDSTLLNTAVTGGDDYEILFAISKAKAEAFYKCLSDMDLQISEIGKINTGEGVTVFDQMGKTVEFEKTSYDHSGEIH